MFKEWRERPPLPTIEQQKEVFKGLKWQHTFHMRSAENDISTFRCDEIGLTKTKVTEHLDPNNPTGMYQLGKTVTTFTLDGVDKKFSNIAEVAAELIKNSSQPLDNPASNLRKS